MTKNKFSNLVEIIDFIDQSYQNPKAFNFKENGKWVSFSTQEFCDNVRKVALALKELGLKKNDGFSITSQPNPIWFMIDFAAMAAGAISVPIFANISSENLRFELEDANVQFVFCDNKDSLKLIQKSGRKFKKIIIYGFETKSKYENIIHFSELLSVGSTLQNKDAKAYQKLTKNIKNDELAAIIYTSGSTGRPKGTMLTQHNMASQINAIHQRFPLKQKSDIAVSFLPLAHIFERVVATFYVTGGISIYFVDDIHNIGDIIREVKPTVMTIVPRLLEKIYAKMRENVNSSPFIKRMIGKAAFHFALSQHPQKAKNIFQKIFHNIFNFLVYKKLQAALGGNFRYLISGSAPLALPLEKFYKNVGIKLFIGYGLTESTAVISANYETADKLGTVGKAFPKMKVKLEKDGELLVKSDVIMQGYHNDKEKTQEALDKNGWLRTGDLAEIDDEGYIKIIGRKKEMFKTSGGKYVSPVPIEQQLLRFCDLLSAACIIAEGRKFVSCLLFADFEILEKYKERLGKSDLSDEEFINSQIIQSQMESLISSVNQKLSHWEKIRKYHLSTKEISIETGELTPSMKLRRSVVEKKYEDVIEGFYEE